MGINSATGKFYGDLQMSFSDGQTIVGNLLGG
jgi:hypothetical protein